MAGRSRRFSSTSVDEIEGHGDRIKHTLEENALKPVAKFVHPDEYPCFILEDATIYMKDKKTIGNLLNAELRGACVVRGRLVVEEEFRSRLLSKKCNGQYIELASCETFSIAPEPVTLWALGESGWLEIRPSEKYQKMYNRMAEAISIYFFVTDLYEKEQRKKGSKIPLSIDKVLLKYAIHDGSGLVRSEAAEKVKSHAEFLLCQMRKESSIVWNSTVFFKWLSAECLDIYAKLFQKSGETILPPTPIVLATLPMPIPQLAPIKPPQPAKPKALPHHSRTSILPPTRSSNPPPTRSTPTIVLSSETSSQTPPPSLLPETSDPLTAILSIMRAPKLDIRGWSTPERMTLSKLGTCFYYAYTLKGEPVSQEIIKMNAASIISSLGTEWKVAPVYAQLKEFASSKPTAKSEIRTQAMAVTEVKRRAGKGGVPSKIDGGPGRPSRQDSERGRPEPHGSKTLLPPHIGRRSGKEAGLRLASSPAMKRIADGESSDDDGSQPRKRRRPSPPELGDDSDDAAELPILANSLPNGVSEELEEEEEDDLPTETKPAVTLKMVTEALPTLSPSGPNGTWTCDREDCVFVVRDAESEEGKERIRAHFNEHAELLEREALARQEAAQRRLPIDHLLEKLRGLGESSRLGRMGEMIGGRMVPEAIKRERGMAV